MLEEFDTTLNESGSEHAGKVTFVKVNVDKLTELSGEMGIAAMPTLIVYLNGKMEKTIVGANFPLLSSTVSSLLIKAKKGGADAAVVEEPDATPAEEEVVEYV